MEIFILIFWVILASAVASYADRRGRNRVAWFVVALIISPVIAIIFLAAAPDLRAQQSAKERAPCPHCAEQILRAAKICPHCRSPLDPGWSTKRRYQSRPA
jgi:hypothetical protein